MKFVLQMEMATLRVELETMDMMESTQSGWFAVLHEVTSTVLFCAKFAWGEIR